MECFETMAVFAEQRSNKQQGPEDQDPERNERKDTPGLFHTVINLSLAGWAASFLLSFYSHTSLTSSLS